MRKVKKWDIFILMLLPLLVLAATYLVYNINSGGRPLRTSAHVAAAHLVLACDDYYEEYGHLPLGSASNNDSILLTTGSDRKSIMHAFVGINETAHENYKAVSFFTFKTARKNKTDGLHLTEANDLYRTITNAELFDPWGSPYHILLDYDNNRQLKDPFSGKIITDAKVLIWSPGPDKESGTDDDIRSWN